MNIIAQAFACGKMGYVENTPELDRDEVDNAEENEYIKDLADRAEEENNWWWQIDEDSNYE